MPNTSHYIVPEKGIISDLSLANSDSRMYTFALNAVTEDKLGNGNNIQNEMSNRCAVEFPPNYEIIGFAEVPEQHRTIYALVNILNGNSQIGEVLDCVYVDSSDKVGKTSCKNCPEYTAIETKPLEKQLETCYCQYRILAEGCLDFDKNYPVDIEYKITNCTFNIYFTDNLNERRFMYFDYTDNNNLESPLKLQDQFKVIEDAPEGGACACPDGYTFNIDTDQCDRQVQTPITPSGDLRTTCHADDESYTNFGVAIYNSYASNGAGTSTIYHTADTYWSNPTANASDGVLNRAALWACGADDNPQTAFPMQPVNEYIGFIFPVDLTATKTYYIGIAGDNKVRIRLDCITIVDMDPNAVAAQYAIGPEAAFKYWHVYPVTIPAGHHVIELTGYNFGSVAGFGAEIYNNTKAQIIAAAGGAGLNIVFSTANMIGEQLQVSDTFSGTCAEGCIDFDAEHNLVCSSTESIDPVCDECITTVVTDELDCTKIKFHPDYERPCVHFQQFVNGGNLAEGSYQILLAYADVYGNPTSNYLPGTPIAPLFENPIEFETNTKTSKALNFEITNLKSDSIFQYYNIVVAQTIDQFTEFILVGTFPTTQHTYTYTGFEQALRRLAPTEVFFKRPYYQLAKGVTTANDYLFFSGVKEYKQLNLQPVANHITLGWETVALKEKAYRDPRNTFYFHTYQRDEVYAFGIVFEFDNGRDTCAFHIPGRAAISTDLEVIDNEDVITDLDCFDGVRNLHWQVYNTATVLGGDRNYNEECEINECWEYGTFAYWESTETYPNDRTIWGDLCGKPIRHHKFPDSCVTHIHDGSEEDKPYSDNNYIFPIGVLVDHESVLNALQGAVDDGIITSDERSSIKSYRIVRGNRVGNKSIDAKGLLFNMWQYDKFGSTYYFSNYPYNDLTSDDFLDDVTLTTQRYTFHSPDTHFTNTGLGNILKIETEEYGKSEGYFTHSECEARHKFFSGFAHTLAFGLGAASALSATGDKVCKTIVYHADDIIQHYDVSSDGSAPYGDVEGTSPGATTTIPASAPWDSTAHVPDITVKHDNMPVSTYDNTTGIGIPSFREATEEQITTCKGQPFQIFNSNPGILALFAGTTIFIQRAFLGLAEMQKILDVIKTIIPYKNYGVQYNSVGKYNNYECVAPGKKIRKIDKAAYLEPIIQDIDEFSNDAQSAFTTIKINNWNRESSVYLKTDTVLANPTHTDNSKTSMSGNGWSGVGHLDERFNRNIASYYGSIKRNVLNQYGQICNINYLETSPCSFHLDKLYTFCESKVFGGDTFINRFALKRKMPFFQHTMCGMPDDSDVIYQDLFNVGNVKYFYNTTQTLGERLDEVDIISGIFGLLSLVITSNIHNYDVHADKVFNQDGYIHLFNYGIPYFLVESDVNIDYRHGENNLEKDFYPHNTDLKNWLEEKYVPIRADNTYFYNHTYSKQNTESAICTSCVQSMTLNCQPQDYNKLIYSEPSSTEAKNDNWLIFKANNNHTFPLSLGRLISADGIENDKVLVRLEKGTQMFPAYNTIQATEQNIQVGTGGLFRNFPQDIAITTLGYAGTQHRDIKHTEFGHIWASAAQGHIFNLGAGGSGIDELTRYGNKNWFKENLPFQIRKDFPEIPIEDIDNNFNGIGLHYCFDKRFSRILVTKLDYKKINSAVLYDKIGKIFYYVDQEHQVNVPVSLKDTKYFCSKSWTRSFNFERKEWTSFHSYMPNVYVEHIDHFDSTFTRTDTQHLYAHNLSNKSYQVFYGKLFPFVVELSTKESPTVNFINSIEFNLDVIRYHNEFDAFYSRTKTFNKAMISNNHQTTGWLNFIINNPEDLTLTNSYPKRSANGLDILVTNSEDMWRFNDFFDISINQQNNLPLFTYDCANVNMQLNAKAVNYDKIDINKQGIRNRMARIRFVNDVESNYHFILNLTQVNQNQSYR